MSTGELKVLESDATDHEKDHDDSSSEDTENEEKNKWKKLKFNKNLENTLKKHGLSKRNVKTIIHSILKNETVKELLNSAPSTNEDDTQINVPEMRLTRSKLKDSSSDMSFKTPWPLSPQKGHFIVQKPKFTEIPLPDEDEEDKEYQPKEDELFESDGDTQESEDTRERCDADASLEDISSQASNDNILNKLDELDKKLEVDLQRNKKEVESMCADSPITEDLISFRTRSKYPLTSTGIDVIEAAFNPPDVTEDMYEPHNVDNYDWQKWLSDLFRDPAPNLNTSNFSHEDDDSEADPDFNYLAEDLEVDKEDLRSDCAVRVTKKELNSLMDELNNDPFYSSMQSTPISSSFNFQTSTPVRDLLNQPKKTKSMALDGIDINAKKTPSPTNASFVKDLDKSCENLSSYQILRRKKKRRLQNLGSCLKLRFSTEQRNQLAQQMQMHIQMLAQTNILTKHSYEYSYYSNQANQLLLELQNFANCASDVKKSGFFACNLNDAVKLCSQEIPISDFTGNMPKSLIKRGYLPLPRNIARAIAFSKACMYVELLPVSSPITKDSYRQLSFLKSEDKLIAISLDEFSSMCSDFATLAHTHYLPTRQSKMIKLRVQNIMASTVNNIEFNPIRVYRFERRLPAPDFSIRVVNNNEVKMPVECNIRDLKTYWLEAIITEEKLLKLSIPRGSTHISIRYKNKPLSVSELWKVDSKVPANPNSQRYSLVTFDDDSSVLVPVELNRATTDAVASTPSIGNSTVIMNSTTSTSKKLSLNISENIQCNYIDSSSIYTGITTLDKSALSYSDPLREDKNQEKYVNHKLTLPNSSNISKATSLPLHQMPWQPTITTSCDQFKATEENFPKSESMKARGAECSEPPKTVLDLPQIRVGFQNRPLDSVVREGYSSKVSCSIAEINGSIKITPRSKMQDEVEKYNQVNVPLKKRSFYSTSKNFSPTIMEHQIKSADVLDWIKTSKTVPSSPQIKSLNLPNSSNNIFSPDTQNFQVVGRNNNELVNCCLSTPTTVISNVQASTVNMDILSLAASCIIPSAPVLSAASPYGATYPLSKVQNIMPRGGIVIATTTVDRRKLNFGDMKTGVNCTTDNNNADTDSKTHAETDMIKPLLLKKVIETEDNKSLIDFQSGKNENDSDNPMTDSKLPKLDPNNVSFPNANVDNAETNESVNVAVNALETCLEIHNYQDTPKNQRFIDSKISPGTSGDTVIKNQLDTSMKRSNSTIENAVDSEVIACIKRAPLSPIIKKQKSSCGIKHTGKRKRNFSKECLKVKFRKTDHGFKAEALKNTPKKISIVQTTKSLNARDNPEQFALEEDTMVQLDPSRIAKESLIAENYLKKVQYTLKNDEDKFYAFLKLFEKFSNNMEAPSRLFFQLKNLLHKWPQLVHGFVPCLMPSQALECKIFNQHKVYAKARKFLRKIEMHYKNDNVKLDKISQVYKELSYEGFYDKALIIKKLKPIVKNSKVLKRELNAHFGAKLTSKSCNHGMLLNDVPKTTGPRKVLHDKCSSSNKKEPVASCLSDVNDISEDALSSSPFKLLSNFPENDLSVKKISRPETPTGLKMAGECIGLGDELSTEYAPRPNTDDASLTGLPVTPGKLPPKKCCDEWTAEEDQAIILNCRQLGGATKHVFCQIAIRIDKHPIDIENRFKYLLNKWNEAELSDSSSSDSE